MTSTHEHAGGHDRDRRQRQELGRTSRRRCLSSWRPRRSTGSTSRPRPRRCGTPSPRRSGRRSTGTAARSTTTCGPVARSRRTPARRCGRWGRRDVAIDGEVLESEPAEPAGDDLADGHGRRPEGRGLHPASPTRSSRPTRASPRSRSSTSSRARRSCSCCSPASGRRRVPVVAGPGSSATSSRCWRPGTACSAEPLPAYRLRCRSTRQLGRSVPQVAA